MPVIHVLLNAVIMADINGLVQERRNSSALAMELRLSCTNLSIWCVNVYFDTYFHKASRWLGLNSGAQYTKYHQDCVILKHIEFGIKWLHFVDVTFYCIDSNEKFLNSYENFTKVSFWGSNQQYVSMGL